MGVVRTVLAVGVLAVSVPALAQPGRSGGERARAERGGEMRGGRAEKGGNDRDDRRVEGQAERHGGSIIGGRITPRGDPPEAQQGRRDPRAGSPDQRHDRRDPRGGPDWWYDRRDRRDEPRVVVRTPIVIDRYDNRVPRPYGRGVGYRYGDRDFRHRDVVTITTWFHSLPPTRLAFYGYYDRHDRHWGGVRYVFRPGIYLSFDLFTRLALLPYDLEYELGILPWYLERRIYGNTVLVIDTRTRYIVDIFEIDY